MALGSDNTTGTRVIEHNSCFGPPELGYKRDRIFMSWGTDEVEGGGWKMHISAEPDQAEIVARIALPILRRLNVPHKVVASLEEYRRFNGGNQRGKFITIYSRDRSEAERALEQLDGELHTYREFGGLTPGPLPTSREANHQEYEIPIGSSGFVSVLFRDDYRR